MNKASSISLSIDGMPIRCREGRSILQAISDAGLPLTDSVGCMGQGVCGSCRILLRRPGTAQVSTALACETLVEDGLQASFLGQPPGARHHPYSSEDWNDSWGLLERLHARFPEASQCRHCGGCDRACPRRLEVQKGVNLAAAGDLAAAATLFDECIMCDLCSIACPEHISPNHLGLYVRRLGAAVALRPSDLLERLQQIDSGALAVDPDAEFD